MSDELSQLRMRLKAEWHDEPVTSKPLTQTPPKIEETSKPVEVTSSLEDQTVKVSSLVNSPGPGGPKLSAMLFSRGNLIFYHCIILLTSSRV